MNKKNEEFLAKFLIGKLSRREGQVLGFISRGFSNREIAKELEISPRTVEIHRGNMLKRLGVETSANAIRYAIIAGFPDTYSIFDKTK